MAGKVRREFDAAAEITLRDIDDGAETADASEAGVALNVLNGAYWDNNEQPNGIFIVPIHITTLDRTTGDETYDFYLEVDTSSSFSSAKEVARLTGVTAVGYYELVVSSQLIEALEAGATHLRVRLDVGGTTPSVVYGAWAVFEGV
jgi:hypothetical protein